MEVEKILSTPSFLPDNDAMLMGKQNLFIFSHYICVFFSYDNMALPLITETEEKRYYYYFYYGHWAIFEKQNIHPGDKSNIFLLKFLFLMRKNLYYLEFI